MEKYKLSIFGKGGHGAEPNEAIDTTIITSEFVIKNLIEAILVYYGEETTYDLTCL